MISQEDLIGSLKKQNFDTSQYENSSSLRAPTPRETMNERSSPSLAMWSLEQLPGMAAAGVAGAIKGVGQLGEDANTLMTRGANRLLPQSMQLQSPQDPFNYPQGSMLGNLERNNPGSSAVGNFVGQTAALGPMAPEGETGSSLLSSVGRNAAVGAGQGALLNPDNPVEGAEMGSFMGGTLGTATNRIANGIPNVDTSVADSAQRLAERGINTNLGVGSTFNIPSLSSVERGLTAFPTGASGDYQLDLHNLEAGTANFLNDLKGNNDPTQIASSIRGSLNNLKDQVTAKDNENYNNLNKVANFLNLGNFVDTSGYRNAAGNILKEANQLTNARPEFRTLQDNDLMRMVKGAANSRDKTDFNTARLTSQTLNQKISDAYDAGDNQKARYLLQLKAGNESDFNNSIEQANQPELKNAWDIARQYHAQNKAPFDTPEMQRFLKNGADPDLIIHSFIRPGQADRSTLASQLLNKLSPEDKNLVGYSYLTRGLPRNIDGDPLIHDNLPQIMKNYAKLDSLPNTKSLLFGDNAQFLDDLKNVHNAVNPGLKAHPIAHGVGLGALAETGREAIAGGGILPLATAVGTLGTGTALNRALRSNTLKNAIRNNSPWLRNTLGSISPAAINLTSRLGLQP